MHRDNPYPSLPPLRARRAPVLLTLVGLALAGAASLTVASTALGVVPPTDKPPVGLPFAPNSTATLAAGPHTNTHHTAPCSSTTPCNSLDFSPTNGVVTAAAPGIVQSVPSACLSNGTGLVLIRHTTGGVYNGWWTGYYHLTQIQVNAGDSVNEGSPLGHEGQALPCGGTPGSGPHVHFFLKYASPSCDLACFGDPFQNHGPDVDLENIVLGGWKITKTGIAQGCMTYVLHGGPQCSPSGVITNYAGASAGEAMAQGHTGLTRYVDPSGSGKHWVSTKGSIPAGYSFESSLGQLDAIHVAGTVPLYSCKVSSAGDQFLSGSPTCEGQTQLGLQGFIYSNRPRGLPSEPVERCRYAGFHFASNDPGCEGQTVEGRLGYAIAR